MADAPDNVLQALRRMVHDDPALQAQLFGLTDSGEFTAAVQQLAADSGCELAADDLLQAMRAGRQAWSDRKLP